MQQCIFFIFDTCYCSPAAVFSCEQNVKYHAINRYDVTDSIAKRKNGGPKQTATSRNIYSSEGERPKQSARK